MLVLVGNPEDRFSHNEAHIEIAGTGYMLLTNKEKYHKFSDKTIICTAANQYGSIIDTPCYKMYM